MSSPKFCLNWNSFETNVCNGLAKLQQNEEFVDMSLFADGHLVKVHKTLLALASPYLKQIIQATPCEHPIIFFNNMSFQILCNILEYIYTGQVEVDVNNLPVFLAAAEQLQLPSIANSSPTVTKDIVNIETEIKPVEKSGPVQEESIKNREADLPVLFDDISFDTNDINNMDDLIQINKVSKPVDSDNEIDTQMVTQENNTAEFQITIQPEVEAPTEISQLYTYSNRGSLQLILNRYMYSSHHDSLQGRKRRWRCIDYRSLHCQAYIDTLDDVITDRKNVHIHPFHDKKIMKKMKTKVSNQNPETLSIQQT